MFRAGLSLWPRDTLADPGRKWYRNAPAVTGLTDGAEFLGRPGGLGSGVAQQIRLRPAHALVCRTSIC
jgi:hypothetical protein